METHAQMMDRLHGPGNWFYGGRYEKPKRRPKKRLGFTRTTRKGQSKSKRRQVKASRRRNRRK